MSVRTATATVLDRVFEVGLALYSILIATSIALSGHHLSRVQEAPTVIVMAFEAGAILGGLTVLAGIFWPGRDKRDALAAETGGLVVLGLTWLAYSCLVWALVGLVGTLAASAGVTWGLCSFLRVWAISRTERAVQRLAETLRAEEDDG